jgi:tetratricopeptide (TPR) repeat protein
LISQNQRAARAALESARGTMARLDSARHPEDAAADIIEGWRSSETALRELLDGSSLEGQALIREARQRNLLTLDQTHSLLQFLSAYERAQQSGYEVTSADIAAARVGFREMENAVSEPLSGVANPTPAPRGSGPTLVPPPPERGVSRTTIATVAVVSALVLGALAWWIFADRGPDALVERGVEHYQGGRREAAVGVFQEAAQKYPESAMPHVYLGRMAREAGDMQTAARELEAAVKLEPGNATAQREMGAYLLQTGNLELARRFYVRAVELDPDDRSAQGYLGCTLALMGQSEAAARFLNRAGPGAWSTCASRVTPAPPGGTRPAVPQ